MMEFPRLVYKDGGPNARAGGTYGHLLVEDEFEFDAAIAAGWFHGLAEAIEASTMAPGDDDLLPTRKELEAKANELGIKFDGRFSDKSISLLIAKAMEA